MDEYDAVLIYDGECAYCSIAAKALRQLDRVGAISWYDDASRAFLEAQFGETPFAMFLVDRSEGQVYAGGAAAQELADRAGTPGIVSALVRDNYDRIAGAVGAVTGRDRDPDDYHETYPLTEASEGLFERLVDEAEERPEALSG